MTGEHEHGGRTLTQTPSASNDPARFRLIRAQRFGQLGPIVGLDHQPMGMMCAVDSGLATQRSRVRALLEHLGELLGTRSQRFA